jgi:hypothetical protein
MNAVEIEEAVSELAGRPFNPAEFPYEFLTAIDNKETTIKKLRSGTTNSSDIPNGVLQRNNIHIAVCANGTVRKTLDALRESPKTTAAKAKFILATDGVSFEAEDLTTSEPLACDYKDFAKHFGFFLPLARISPVKEIKNNPFDIKATGRLNKLYVELLKDNPDWATEAKRPALNQFIARLIFCFFAEDTGIFLPKQFTKTLEQMSDSQSGNTDEVLCELFRAMDLKPEEREAAKVKNWANVFPYVNGGMFTGAAECPKFNRIARSYLLAVGNLEWDKINPDIFGSMIQAVADDDERSEIGMHYTSVPNILKVLNPLFLDSLRMQLDSAGDNIRKLRNLRKKLATLRVFDPACGSGNFLVIAYKEMRAIEHQTILRTKDEAKSWIKLENFCGIELKGFAVEIARLALLIAEFQCDVQYISQQEARAMVLPLHKTGQIVNGNALLLNWAEICPPKTNWKAEIDLAGPTGRLALEQSDSEESDESKTYICGNPPYVGRKYQSETQKKELREAFGNRTKDTLTLDYVSGWFIKASEYISVGMAEAAFVSTNSICQGAQVPILWPVLHSLGISISFAYTSFKWANLASHNAGVTVIIVGLSRGAKAEPRLFTTSDDGSVVSRKVENINSYLVPGQNVEVHPRKSVPDSRTSMQFGNHPYYANPLILDSKQARELQNSDRDIGKFLRPLYGSKEFISGVPRTCIWIQNAEVENASNFPFIRQRIELTRSARLAVEDDAQAQRLVDHSHRFRDQFTARHHSLIVPIVSSENRPYLPVGVLSSEAIIHSKAFALYDAPLWNFAVIASRLHWVWVGTVCVRMRTDFSYSNTLGWNTFPLPTLSDQNKADLTNAAENIILTREHHFPATIADLYDSDEMPLDLKRAHEASDEILERIFIGRRFRNDTERLEKLFEMYSRTAPGKEKGKKKAKRIA